MNQRQQRMKSKPLPALPLRTVLLSIAFALASIVDVRIVAAQEVPEFFTGVRQLGMGGAYTAVVNDETALLSNPAGLGKLRDLTFTLVDPEIHIGTMALAKPGLILDSFEIQGLMEVLKESPGEHWHSKLQLFPSFVGPNFGIGVHVKYVYDAQVSEDGSTYQLDFVNDYAAALGYNFRFFGGIMKLGFAVRLVNRVEIADEFDTAATNLEIKSLAAEGMGIGADAGLILTAPVALLPSLSIVVRDVGNTSYTVSDGMFYSADERPRVSQQKIDAGLAIFPIAANHVRTTLTAEIHDVLNTAEEEDVMRRLHAGIELNVRDFFFLRAGMNQRYWTGGIELASERFQLQAASYGEDIGTDGNPVEDRRFVGKITFRF